MTRTVFIRLTLVWLTLCTSLGAFAQYSFYGGMYSIETANYQGADMQIFHFSRQSNRSGQLKAAYFAQNANAQYEKWKQGKQVLFYCAGAFSETWEVGSVPQGICVDNGVIVNRNLDPTMKGLVIVYNGGAQAGGIAVVNLEKDNINVTQGGTASYNLSNYRDKENFLAWASTQGATVFQTQLMYTSKYGFGFTSGYLRYGERSTRRLLAVCTKNGVVHHMVVNYNTSEFLNTAAQKLQYYLSSTGYEVVGMMNLDVGGKDIMCCFNDSGATLGKTSISITQATNLLVYYIDK